MGVKDEPPEVVWERLTVSADSRQGVKQSALIEIANGGLELIGGALSYPDYNLALTPPYVVKVTSGALRLHDFHLLGPTQTPPRNYRGLIFFQGNGAEGVKGSTCVVSDSMLRSARGVLHLEGTGARVRLWQSLLVAGGDALTLQPGAGKGGLSVQMELDQTTVAARGAVVRLGDAPEAPPAGTPMVLQSRASAFVQPFADKGGLLRFEGEALSRGVLLWQSDGDAYDRRLHYAAAGGEASPDKPQPPAEWARLWGLGGVRKAVTDRPFTRAFTAEKWPFEALTVPPPRDGGTPPPIGADLVKLGLVKK
jgi:hypothetical protein